MAESDGSGEKTCLEDMNWLEYLQQCIAMIFRQRIWPAQKLRRTLTRLAPFGRNVIWTSSALQRSRRELEEPCKLQWAHWGAKLDVPCGRGLVWNQKIKEIEVNVEDIKAVVGRVVANSQWRMANEMIMGRDRGMMDWRRQGSWFSTPMGWWPMLSDDAMCWVREKGDEVNLAH